MYFFFVEEFWNSRCIFTICSPRDYNLLFWTL